MYISKRKTKLNSTMLAFLLAVLVLAGCAKGEDNTKGSNESVTNSVKKDEAVELRFAWWGSQGRHDRTVKVIEKFTELHPNITIKPEYSSWDGYWEKLSTQVAGDNAPDLIQMSILYIKEYSERGVLLDLNPFKGKEFKTDDLNAEILQNQGTIQGKLTGIPVADNASVMYFNKEMYQQAGVEPPKMDMTWQEYFDKAREMKGKLGDKVFAATDFSANYEGFMYYLFSVGDSLYKDNKLGYDDQNLKNWLTMWDEARKEGLLPSASDTASFLLGAGDPNKDPFMKGLVPILGPGWTGSFPAYENVMKDKIDMISVPKDKKAGSVLETAMFLTGSAKTKHPKEVAMFIDFFVNSQEAADILETDRGIPDNTKIREYLAPKFSERDNKMINMLEHVGSIDPSWYDAGPKGAGEVSKLFEQTVQKQQFNKATIDEIVSEFRKEADKVFEKNK